MRTQKSIHISITITVDGKPVAYEKWVSEQERKDIEKVMK
jgi:hypothetical protein